MTSKSTKKSSKNRKKGLRWDRMLILMVPLVLAIALIWYGGNKLNPLQLKSAEYVAEYQSEFNPLDNLKSLFMDSTDNITVEGNADTATVGDYPMSYTYKGKNILLL